MVPGRSKRQPPLPGRLLLSQSRVVITQTMYCHMITMSSILFAIADIHAGASLYRYFGIEVGRPSSPCVEAGMDALPSVRYTAST